MNIEKELKQALLNIDKLFGKNELAYLALTSKIENPIRDKIAVYLNNKLYEKDILIAREWKRTDIAAIKNGVAVSLIEIKAMYTFDAIRSFNSLEKFSKWVAADEAKAKNLGGNNNPDVYTILLATHPKSTIHTDFYHVVKYAGCINACIKNHNQNVKLNAELAVKTKFCTRGIIHSGTINGGSAFGIETEVLFWIMKAS